MKLINLIFYAINIFSVLAGNKNCDVCLARQRNGENIACGSNCITDNTLIDYDCPIPYVDCGNNIACPKVTEITHCSLDGINGYTTYRLSIVLKDTNKNIYAIFGEPSHTMYIPPAYQIKGAFGTNIGGVSDEILSINPDSYYDSWLTIGIVNGDLNNNLGTIGIDFENWGKEALTVNNGAIFTVNPEERLGANEYIIGQLTILDNIRENVIINIQGKNSMYPDSGSWKLYDLTFELSKPEIINNIIPSNCEIWFDGCNTCLIVNNRPSTCTELPCPSINNEEPNCLRFINGH